MLVGAKKLARIRVSGVVQGVGFRPFIYRLAKQHNLFGWVRNTSGNVEIEVEGSDSTLKKFLSDLEISAPPVAHIEEIMVSFGPLADYADFQIRDSLKKIDQYQLISPDIATCKSCRKEIFSVNDRRYRYPFTNCTNCGPRFTIIEDIPYDRPKTTMRAFQMCPQCQQEYDDPLNRRFHAQPNACPQCGPQLKIVDGDGRPIECNDVIAMASSLLMGGNILAIRGLGGFHLACDATNETVVSLLRDRKQRPAKPFAVMMATIEEVEKHCIVTPEERDLLQSPQAPIVLLWWKRHVSNVCSLVAPQLKYLGVMLPYTPLHHLLLAELDIPLVMTSGNLTEEPIAKDNDEALRRLQGIADFSVLHDRDIFARYDDSVFMVVENLPQVLRRARSYAPYPIFLPFNTRPILACGAEDKNTFCLTKNNHAFLSQHIGDMENEETLQNYDSTIELYKRIFRIEPEIIAYDMHPEYLSTKFAHKLGFEQGLEMVAVQHHHAHLAKCLLENGIMEPVIGVAFDGTGFGTDGAIWGGEFFVVDWKQCRRVGHLEYVPLPGGSAAIKRPYRMALGYLISLLDEDVSLEGLPLEIGKEELLIIKQQLKSKINTPLTSSAGRLFDGISALCGIRGEISYEAQAAIELEMVAHDEAEVFDCYPFSIAIEYGIKLIRLGEFISAVVSDIKNQVPLPIISLKFHNTIADIIAQMSRLIRKETGLSQVALSGGVFQNRLLFKLVNKILLKEDFEVFTHHLVPCNDGGISLGQAVVAHFGGSEEV